MVEVGGGVGVVEEGEVEAGEEVADEGNQPVQNVMKHTKQMTRKVHGSAVNMRNIATHGHILRVLAGTTMLGKKKKILTN